MINYIRNMTPLAQIAALNISVSALAVLGIAWAASAQSITPQSRPDCTKVVCTADGAKLGKPKVTVTVTPQATITQVCYLTSCTSSWVPHEFDKDAVGQEPQTFVIPKKDRE